MLSVDHLDNSVKFDSYHSESGPEPVNPHVCRTARLLNEFVMTDALRLALPGKGDTWSRFATLAKWASRDLSLGRLCEGHADAVAILHEAGRTPVPDVAYGVWASRSKGNSTFAERVRGGWRLSGAKEFCSGSGIVDRALVTAHAGNDYLLFDVDVRQQVASAVANSWPSVGMAHSMSETLLFDGPVIADEQIVAGPNFYLDRTGFWFGAVGVAACWFGGTVALLNGVLPFIDPDANQGVLADLGFAVGELETMRYALRSVAREIDEDPCDVSRQAKFRALTVRQSVHDAALRVMDRVASAGGARPLCQDPELSRCSADLFVYLSQHHGNADARELGHLITKARSWG